MVFILKSSFFFLSFTVLFVFLSDIVLCPVIWHYKKTIRTFFFPLQTIAKYHYGLFFVKFQRNLQLTSDLTCTINRLQALFWVRAEHGLSGNTELWPYFWQSNHSGKPRIRVLGGTAHISDLKKWWVYEISQWVESHS